VEQLFSTAHARVIEKINIAAGVAAEKLAKLPVALRKAASVDARPMHLGFCCSSMKLQSSIPQPANKKSRVPLCMLQ